MTAKTPHGGGTDWAALMLAVLVLASAHGAGATTPIYKCLDRNLGLVYTDEPCKDGEVMNIRAGDADPAAVARLERARDAIDQSAAQRIVDQRRAAEQRNLADWYFRGDERYAYDAAPTYAPYYSGAIGWLPGAGRHHPLRNRPPRPLEARHFAPRPPYMVPRR